MKPKPFAGGRWTEARRKSFIVNALRRASIKWPVRGDVLKKAQRPAEGEDLPKNTKWEYQCNSCKEWFFGKEVEVDHIEECGSHADINQFAQMLFCESDNLQVLCKPCHRAKGK